MIQLRVSNYEENRASENVAYAEWMIKRRASRYESTRASENAADDEHYFSFWSYQHCGHTHNSSWMNLQREQFNPQTVPLNDFWAYIIHKSQGKTLDLAKIYEGKSEKCSGMKLVAISRLHKLSNFLLLPISLWKVAKG